MPLNWADWNTSRAEADRIMMVEDEFITIGDQTFVYTLYDFHEVVDGRILPATPGRGAYPYLTMVRPDRNMRIPPMTITTWNGERPEIWGLIRASKKLLNLLRAEYRRSGIESGTPWGFCSWLEQKGYEVLEAPEEYDFDRRNV